MIVDTLACALHDLARASRDFPEANLRDAFSRGQLASKTWAVAELAKLDRDLGCTFVLAGWYGVLPLLMLSEPTLRIRRIRCFDIDPSCQPVADTLNRSHLDQNWRFKAVTRDIFDIDYREYVYTIPKSDGTDSPVQRDWPHTIINTSCDHIGDFSRWWAMLPQGRLVLVQNNDFHEAGEDHVNTVGSLGEFKEMAPMSRVFFEGVLDLGAYRRFMLIGER